MVYLVTAFPTTGKITNVTAFDKTRDEVEALYRGQIERGICHVLTQEQFDAWDN